MRSDTSESSLLINKKKGWPTVHELNTGGKDKLSSICDVAALLFFTLFSVALKYSIMSIHIAAKQVKVDVKFFLDFREILLPLSRCCMLQ